MVHSVRHAVGGESACAECLVFRFPPSESAVSLTDHQRHSTTFRERFWTPKERRLGARTIFIVSLLVFCQSHQARYRSPREFFSLSCSSAQVLLVKKNWSWRRGSLLCLVSVFFRLIRLTYEALSAFWASRCVCLGVVPVSRGGVETAVGLSAPFSSRATPVQFCAFIRFGFPLYTHPHRSAEEKTPPP